MIQKEREITALMFVPGNYPSITILENSLDALQKAVSIGSYYQGHIEVLGLEPGVCLICNEEAKFISLLGNRRIGKDIIAGVFYIVGVDDNREFTSIPMAAMRKYSLAFWEPEHFTEQEVADSIWIDFEAMTD